ncbi:MAG: hypothetical protein K9H64_04045 [Bacteroidales bacterium]|nr:hypothetical protein [Bacteroidales bacterium]MCF8455061.1 hypothetical protein [Bacteroidales bacterium]
MQTVDLIIDEFDKLKFEQRKRLVSILFDRLLGEMNEKKKVASKANVFKQYRGIAKGFWNMDAQEYVNNLRIDNRF